jgi:hypothetical protein
MQYSSLQKGQMILYKTAILLSFKNSYSPNKTASTKSAVNPKGDSKGLTIFGQ